MFPDLLHFAGFSVTWHGVLIMAGVIAGVVIAQRLARKRGLDVNLLGDMVFWAVIWGIIGSRVVFILTSPGEFRGASLMQLIDMRMGGNSFHGGIIGGVLTLLYYQWRYKVNLYRYADLIAPGVALGIIGGRIGNFFNGSDSTGRLTGWPIGFTWPRAGEPFLGFIKSERNWASFRDYCYGPSGTTISFDGSCVGGQLMRGPVHLTQIYGALVGVALLIGLIFWMRSRKPGWVFWNMVLWYSLLRTIIEEPFRLNPLWWPVYLSEGPGKAGIGLFTATQIFSIPLILVSVYMLWRISRRSSEDVSPVPGALPELSRASASRQARLSRHN